MVTEAPVIPPPATEETRPVSEYNVGVGVWGALGAVGVELPPHAVVKSAINISVRFITSPFEMREDTAEVRPESWPVGHLCFLFLLVALATRSHAIQFLREPLEFAGLQADAPVVAAPAFKARPSLGDGRHPRLQELVGGDGEELRNAVEV